MKKIKKMVLKYCFNKCIFKKLIIFSIQSKMELVLGISMLYYETRNVDRVRPGAIIAPEPVKEEISDDFT